MVTLDAEGRLSTLLIDMPAVGEEPKRPINVVYSDYGVQVAVKKPRAKDIIEAPEAIYGTLTA